MTWRTVACSLDGTRDDPTFRAVQFYNHDHQKHQMHSLTRCDFPPLYISLCPGGRLPSDSPAPPFGGPHYPNTRKFSGTEIAAQNERIHHKKRSKGCQFTETYSLTASV